MSFIKKIQVKYKIMAADHYTRDQALKYVNYVLDEDGNKLPKSSLNLETAILVGWHRYDGLKPFYVAVQNKDGSMLTDLWGIGSLKKPASLKEKADEIAYNFLLENYFYDREAAIELGISRDQGSDYIYMPDND